MRRRVGELVLLVLSAAVLITSRASAMSSPAGPTDQVDTWGSLVEYMALVGVVLAASTLLVRRRPDGQPAGAVRGAALSCLGVGVAVMTAYLALGAAGTGIGTPSDIGGGLLVLLGYLLTAVGTITAVRDRRHRGISDGRP